jgi:hypothetical protein
MDTSKVTTPKVCHSLALGIQMTANGRHFLSWIPYDQGIHGSILGKVAVGLAILQDIVEYIFNMGPQIVRFARRPKWPAHLTFEDDKLRGGCVERYPYTVIQFLLSETIYFLMIKKPLLVR